MWLHFVKDKYLLKYFLFNLLFFLLIFNACKKKEVPIVETLEITEIKSNSAIGRGKIVSDGGTAIIGSGVCWSLKGEPTINDNKTVDPVEDGNFVSTLSNLDPATAYCVRAYATNSEGTGYGQPVYFQTSPESPLATIISIKEITAYSVVIDGVFSSGVGVNILSVGIVYGNSMHPTFENSLIESSLDSSRFKIKIENLKRNTKYYVRPYVVFRFKGESNYNVIFGNELSLMTKYEITPTIKLGKIVVWAESANIDGVIIDNGGAPIVKRGISLKIADELDSLVYYSSTELDSFTISINNLKPDTKYIARAFAQNSVGISLSSPGDLKTCTGLIKDITGHTYRTQKIGTQLWIQENLQVTNLNDNSSIPLVIENSSWETSVLPSYCWSGAKENSPYGCFYNWYTINTGKLCPTGWHVPTIEEWHVLFNYLESLGGYLTVGQKLAEPEFGFIALNAGRRYSNGSYYCDYYSTYSYGYWWSSSLSQNFYPAYWELTFNLSTNFNIRVTEEREYANGYSVRCIKDN
jgi:uncharacterized protein (TIGR02145 family)